MTTEERAKDFLLACIQQAKVLYPTFDANNVQDVMIMQLAGKIFELEDRIKELENDRKEA